MIRNKQKLQHFSESVYIDADTGETILSDQVKSKQYYITNTQITYHDTNSIRITRYTKQCKRSGQLEIKY